MTSRRGNYYVVQGLASMHQHAVAFGGGTIVDTAARSRIGPQCQHVTRFAYRLCRSDGFGANDAHRQT